MEDAGLRPSCAACGEPIELADSADLESWIHAAYANYWGDHAAWVEDAPEIQQESSSSTKNGVKQRHRSTTQNGL